MRVTFDINPHNDDDKPIHLVVALRLDPGTIGAIASLLAAPLIRIETALNVINQRGIRMEQVTQDVLDAVKDIGEAVDQIPPAIDKLEADVTAAINNSKTMAPEDKAALTQAVSDLRGKISTVQAAIADAADGIDEAANPPGGTTGGTGGGTTGGTPAGG